MKKTVLISTILAALAFAFAAPAAQAEPAASVSASCSIKGNFPPASYVTSISGTRVACSKARKVVKAYHACRGKKAGKCSRKVLGFKCREGKRQTVPGVQYSARVACSKGKAKVNSSYTQNL